MTWCGSACLEPYALLALVIYAAVGWVLARVVWLLIGETRSASVTRTHTAQTTSTGAVRKAVERQSRAL